MQIQNWSTFLNDFSNINWNITLEADKEDTNHSIVNNIFTLIKETMFNTFEDISCACQRDFFSSVVICCLWRLLSLGGETASLR